MIAIIGAGKVGAMVAFNILMRKISDVVLIDAFEDVAHGQAMDMMQASPAIEFDGTIWGTHNFSEMKGAELVIVTAGIGRQPGMTRLDLIKKNAETIRLLVNNASVTGIPITSLLEKEQIQRIVEHTKTSGADVIKLKGSTVFAPAAVIAIMVDAVLRGRNRVMGVSVHLQGEDGFSDVSIGVPCVLGKNGVEKILEIKLDPDTKEAFAKSVAVIKASIDTMNAS